MMVKRARSHWLSHDPQVARREAGVNANAGTEKGLQTVTRRPAQWQQGISGSRPPKTHQPSDSGHLHVGHDDGLDAADVEALGRGRLYQSINSSTRKSASQPSDQLAGTRWLDHEKAGVLVVDEDDLARVVLQLGLGLNCFEVWSAADGFEAVHLYLKHADRIAVVLLDFRMPGLDGLAMLDALRDLNPEVQVCFMGSDTAVYGLEALIQRRRGRR